MTQTPRPRSFNQVLGEISDSFLSRQGLPGLKRAGPALSILEVVAQNSVRTSQDIFTLLNQDSLKRARGQALDRIGLSEKLPRIQQSPSTGKVDIYDDSFVKISSTISQAQPAPIVGSGQIHVTDASSFPATGSIYIGRGTAQLEGPLAYNAKTNNGTHWTLTLVATTLRFHNQSEPVVVAQGGNRTISAGSTVQTPQGNVRDAVKFTTIYSATIPDGEVVVMNVPVVAQVPGVIGNVGAGAISAFAGGGPFTGARVSNPLPFTNGLATERDDAYRERIEAARNSRTKGTALALTTYSIGVTANDENRKVISSSFVPGIGDAPGTLYIDDGTGYEERSSGVAVESLTDQALGGETHFELVYRPVAKAFLTTGVSGPFTLVTGSKLAFIVGGVTTEHTLDATRFRTIGNATPFELATSINADSALLWGARTTDSGNKIAVFAKADTNEDIELAVPSGTDANQWLAFPTGRADTLRLYRDDRLLSKDGRYALVVGKSFSFWQPLSGPQTLILATDNTPAVTYTFTDADFINQKTGYITVGLNSLAAWITVLNSRLPGVTASITLGAIQLVSNKGASGSARLQITGGTLVTNGVFAASDAVGANRDYVLDRNLSQLELSAPLSAGQRLAAGTTQTRAFVETPSFTTVSLAAQGNAWFAIDSAFTPITIGVSSSTPVVITIPSDGIKHWGTRLRLTVVAGAFSNVVRGDVVVLWDAQFNADLRGNWHVALVAGDGSYIEIEKSAMNAYRGEHAQVTLADGRVLVCGGWSSPHRKGANKSAEIFDPTTKKWTTTGDMSVPRVGHTVTLLPSGKVLVYGGSKNDTDAQAVAAGETWDPATGVWTPVSTTGQPAARNRHAAALGHTGLVYITGGKLANATYSDGAYTYDPVGDAWATLAVMTAARAGHTLTLLTTTNKLMAVGGENSGGVMATTELYDPGTSAWAGSGSIQSARQAHRSVFLPSNNKLLVTGGSTSVHTATATPTVHTDLYDGAWANGTAMAKARAYHGLALLANGKVVVGFGDQTAGTPYAEIYDPAAPSWTNLADPSGAYARRRVGCSALSANRAIFTGGIDVATLERPRASYEIYDAAAPGWTVYDPNVGTVNLATSGFTVARMGGRPIPVQIPTGNNYTASAAADALRLPAAFDSGYRGAATPAIFRTTQIRAATNTFARRQATTIGTAHPGDIGVLAADVEAQKLGFPVGTRQDNLDGHLGSVESANPETGTPFFDLAWVKGAASATVAIGWSGISATTLPLSSSFVVGLGSNQDSYTQPKAAQNYGWWSMIAQQSYDGLSVGLDYVTVRRAPDKQFTPEERVYFAQPYAISPYDSLVVLADGDTASKRYQALCYRKLKPVGTTYAASNTYQDADPTTPTTLATAFGQSYDFTDHAVYMRARTITHSADASKRVLWRWFRHGPEGEAAAVSYGLPAGPDKAVEVQVQDDLSTLPAAVLCTIRLASGAAKTGYALRPGTRVGVACTAKVSSMGTAVYVLGLSISSAVRAANVTTLTLTLPAGVTNHGFTSGNVVWVQSIDPDFSTGAKSITSVTATTIAYSETAADEFATPNIGTVSYDTTEATLATAAPAVAPGDFFRLESTSAVDANYEGQTLRLTAAAAQHVIGQYEGFAGAVNTTLTWGLLTDQYAFKLFANPAQSATTIAAAVTALYQVANTKCPIYPTVTGTGAGIIDRSSSEEAAAASTIFPLTDGRNWILSQVNPPTAADNYQFTFKDAITASLAANSDWANEDVRLVPVSAKALARWLMQPAIGGLFTSLLAQPSSRGRHLQLSTLTPGSAGRVEVQGGGANAWSAAVKGAAKSVGSAYTLVNIPRSALDSPQAQGWFSLTNSQILPKPTFDAASKLTSVDVAGKFVMDAAGTPVWIAAAPAKANASMLVERHGAFTCFSDSGQGTAVDLSTVLEGDWVIISKPAAPTGGSVPQVSDANVGTYRIVRAVHSRLDDTSAFWIESTKSVESVPCEMDLKFIKRDSLMPGDTVQISTSVWGAGTQGKWVVTSVGDAGAGSFTNQFTFRVDVTSKAIVAAAPAAALGAQAPLVTAHDSAAFRSIKKLVGTSIDQDSPATLAHLKFQGDRGWEYHSEAAGCAITALDKLAFTTSPAAGQDGYRRSTGLLAAVNQVIYGDTTDPATYPGVAAAGARINIAGPLVRRIQFAMLVRLRSGYPAADVGAAVRSAMASVINQSKMGRAIAISSIIAAAESVVGVESVVPVTKYAIGADLIAVQPNEKPLVLDLDNDLLVSFVGV